MMEEEMETTVLFSCSGFKKLGCRTWLAENTTCYVPLTLQVGLEVYDLRGLRFKIEGLKASGLKG